ncbi:LOW QUALITY PROTEIN: hypothetical protein OSB04_un000168, partial [Centaurea solstitialis]
MEGVAQTSQPAAHLGQIDPTMVVTDDVLGDSDNDMDLLQTDAQPSKGSVFDRLNVDERLKFPATDSLNFAAAVGGQSSDLLSFFPLADKNLCSYSSGACDRGYECAYKTTLFGYFLGPRLNFAIVEKYAKTNWSKFGLTDVMLNNNGIFFFKFNDVGGSNQVVAAGPTMIRGVPFFVENWEPGKGITKPIHNVCPLWVKLHNIPLVAFNKEGISRIASALGVPKQMDACTTSMCDNSWGRPAFAKVLIDTWAVGELKREVQVLIPSLKGGDDVRVIVKVEYLWEPTQCSHCLVFGHKISSCAKAVWWLWLKKGNLKWWMMMEWRPKRTDSTFGTKEAVGGGSKPPPNTASSSGVASGVAKSGTSIRNLNTSPGQTVVGKTVVNAGGESSVQASIGGRHVMPPPGYVCTSRGSPDTPFKQSVVSSLKLYTARRGTFIPSAPTSAGGIETSNAFSSLATAEDSVVDKEKGDKSSVWVRNRVMIMQMLSIASWNIRGLNASDKQQEVKAFVRNNNLAICAILESHVKGDGLSGVCSSTFGRWDWVSNHLFSDLGTRIIIAWDGSVLEVMPLEYHRQFIHCEVRVKGSSNPFFMSIVYADNRGCERKQLWSGLRKFRAILGPKPWVILGDFNCLLFPHDALGGVSRRNSDMVDFACCLEDIETFDVHFTGIHYTWCQKPKSESGLKRKLDRILANTEFTELFGDACARFAPRGLSDHSPGLVQFREGKRICKPGFKFDNFLIDDPCFLSTVQQAWSVDVEGTFMFRVTSKLKALKGPFRRLRSAYGNLSTTSVRLKDELDVAQLAADFDPDNPVLGQDVSRLREAYQRSCWADLSASRQRAKVKWLTEGDANTKYFHRVIQERRHARFVHSVANSQGVFVFDDDVAMAFIEHFMSIIGTVDEEVMPIMDDSLFVNRLSIGEANHMIRPILDEEIRQAIFSIGNDKSPGSDGFSAKFFKAAWDVIGSDVLLAIHNFFYRGRISKEINHTLLCLLPKSPNASSVSEFRPIACCSVLYKCISKIIVERMKPYLDRLLSRAQSAFIPGRKIGDNILMAHELVVGYHLEKGPPRCAFKIDLRKAYDMVSWDYLFRMLEGFNFHPVLIKWIREMVSTASFSVVVNGEARGFFQGKRGIRQGDPLSPYLFTIVMEGFSLLFKQCISEAATFGYHLGCQDLELTHLCFADDLFVFTRGDVQSVEVLKKTLSLFALRSGLAPNLQKSDVFFGNVDLSVREAILHYLPFRAGTFPIRYLGVPLSPVSLKPADLNPLVSSVRLRIQNWKSKFLSFGGRRQLVISVLQSLQLYWMAVFLIPSGVVHEIEKLLRNFIWAQGDPAGGKCKVAWDLICRPLENGGLGFRRLGLWNRALLTKNLWSILTNRDCLWVSWVRSYALRNSCFWTARKTSRWSWVLVRIMNLRDEVRQFISVRLGNGSRTNAWEDVWLPCGRLSAFGFAIDTTVLDLVDTFQDGWPDHWKLRFPLLSTSPIPTLQMDGTDGYCWDLGGNGHGTCTVQSIYTSLAGQMPVIPWWKAVWFKGHIPKHAFCLWTTCLKRLPTLDRVATWKEEPPDLSCRLCGIANESHDHLFFECSFSRQVWIQVMDKVALRGFPCSWTPIIDALSDQSTRPNVLEHSLVLAATVYTVWCERNQRIFRDISKPVPHLVQLIMTAVLDRAAWKRRKKKT